jgi:DNA polymerase III sliding clamp (beta) subunit (PCNA family)
MTKVVFETATLRDVVLKARQVAPRGRRGDDKAAGIVFDIDPAVANFPAMIRATDLMMFYSEFVWGKAAEGDKTRWRLSAKQFGSFVENLPIGEGKEVILEEIPNASGSGSSLKATAGRTRAMFNLMDITYYPTWEWFDPAALGVATGLGKMLGRIDWATAKDEGVPVITGIMLDGQRAVATNRYALAVQETSIEGMDRQVTIPGGTLGQIIRHAAEPKLTATGNELLVMPDDYTQIRLALLAGDYLNIDALAGDFGQTESMEFFAKQAVEAIQRAQNVSEDVNDALSIYVYENTFDIMMTSAKEVTHIDEVELSTSRLTQPKTNIVMQATMLVKALSASPNDKVTLWFRNNQPKSPLRLDGGSGYQVWMAPRADATKNPEGA